MDTPQTVEVEVNGHTKGNDDNGSDKNPTDKPAETPATSVDESGKTPVDPTDDAQDTGVIVKYPTKDTTVTATDEDGKDIPVEIDDKGHIIVTPGKDVDGPIKVTVDDPSMDAPQTVEVEVNGHTKGNDDNGSDKNPTDKPAETPATSVDESGKTPVDPTDEAQDTGVIVKYPTKDTTVTATDEDGKDIPVEIDDKGHIIVTPGKDVDGPITVTVDDPSMDAPQTVEVEVNGHTKGNDDNGSDKPANNGENKPNTDKPAETPATSVDESGKTPVDPTDDAQDTGVVVVNPTKDTTVTAKDEDGKDIPVEIDDKGHIIVTPGKDVDGPITVTVDDPSMDAPQTVEVEVNGHTKGNDDNGSDKPANNGENKPNTDKPAETPVTSVDESGKTPVDPTDDAQDTGVVVVNPTKDTTVTAKDEDGKDIPVEIDDKGHIIVTPGKDVDGPITVTVDDPSMDTPQTVGVEVNGHTKGNDDNNKATADKGAENNTPSIADQITPNIPAKTPVKDTNHLTDAEKEAVKNAIEKVNNFPAGTVITIADNGTATITYPDGSQDTIAGSDLVVAIIDGNDVKLATAATATKANAKNANGQKADANTNVLPQTGAKSGNATLLGAIALAAGTMFGLGFSKKKED
ncbi:hypothetical protein FC40_GL001210 [Ligilactobacillus hayakitensis DSM 18933 = JCM 14209]|uniref:Gram-positive cocci surface proteins LPxTG domain-containing protein n=3 Tax=Ligilactobacillus TaxID=2767887 RepID=A0A0R1WHU2_9LACO|nr:hypothetical protein FC40_GL001210 [Ligilactobacillus hayakitensis DSM 18933 = JCM 14209]